MKYTKDEVENAYMMLRKYLPQGATVHCVLRGVSRSGMQRRIDFFAIDANDKASPRLQYLTGWMNVIFGSPRTDSGMKVNGCGMDMGFHVVEQLSHALYGFKPSGIRGGLRHEWI